MNVAGIESGALYAAGVVVLIVGALVIAWLMWKVVEEPAREWMRGLVGTRRTPTEEAGEEIMEGATEGHPARGGPIDPVAIPETDER
jgi:peptidoglycan/LPS O-acetylase OafA/YrhL